MKKYIIVIIAMLFSLSIMAQRKTVTDKLQVTKLKNAEVLKTDAKGNVVAGSFEGIKSNILSKLEELRREVNAELQNKADKSQLTAITTKIIALEQELSKKVSLVNFNNYVAEAQTQLSKINKLVTDVTGNTTSIANIQNSLSTEVARLEGLIANAGKVKTVNSIAPDNVGNIAISVGLEKITQNGKTGWRLVGVDTSKYVSIGEDAIDLSLIKPKDIIYSKYGASGFSSFAIGVDNTASGIISATIGGIGNTASGANSTTIGGSRNIVRGRRSAIIGGSRNIVSEVYSATIGGADNTVSGATSATIGGVGNTASGANSVAMGFGTLAKSSGEVAIGLFTTDYVMTDSPTDRLFVIGNGKNNTSRSDALIVYKNGNMDLNGLLKLKPMSAPATAQKGTIYFDSADNKLKCYDGTTWHNLF